jgi:hypothetical protein
LIPLDSPQGAHRFRRVLLQPPASLSADALAMFLTAEMRSVRVLHYEHMPDLYATLPLITLDYP